MNFKRFSSFEYQITSLKFVTETLIVTCIYFPHGYQSVIQSELCELFDHLQSLTGTHLMLGDCNTHVNDLNCKTAENFIQLTDCYNWVQHVNIPTHRKGNTLDLVLSHADLSVSNIHTDRSVPTDHYCVLFDVSSVSPGLPKRTISCRKWADTNLDALNDDIKTAFSDYDPVTTEDAVRKYNETLTSLADKHAPLKRRTVTLRPESPWYTSELTREKRLRRNLEDKYRKSNLVVDRDRYNDQRNIYNSKLTSAKELFYKSKITDSKNCKDRLTSVMIY